MNRTTIINKVLARLIQDDYDIIVDFVKRNLEKSEELIKYFDVYTKRNKVDAPEKVKILKRLQDESINLKKYPWTRIVKEFNVVF